MKKKIKQILKIVLILVLCVASLATTVLSAIPLAEARGTTIIGTNTALGSPMLNDTNFQTEDWNKWETICWGVFLSNFCQPLIDTYATAFRETGSTNDSNGAGFSALWGGSGSDKANAKVIKALCDYAIDAQKAYSDKIYVAYTSVTDGVPNNKAKPGDSGVTVREATFNDLWLTGLCNEKDCTQRCSKHSWANYKYCERTTYESASGNTSSSTGTLEFKTWTEGVGDDYKNYDEIIRIEQANLPTFYVKRGTEYVEIWDYTDWWDIQVIASMTNTIRNQALGEVFESNFLTFWDDKAAIELDPFGNIVIATSQIMVIPSAVNQHISNDNSINTLNSWMMNSYVNTVSSEDAVLGLRQTLQTQSWELSQTEITNGYPAFGRSNIGHIGLFYYDLDTIYVDAFRNNKDLSYGNNLLTLFNLQLTNEKTSTVYPIKYEVAGNGVGGISWWRSAEGASADINSDKFDWVMTNTYLAASMLPNINFTYGNTQKTLLSEIIKPDGKTVSLFSTNPVLISVKTKQSSESSEDSSVTNEGTVRRFYNFLYQCYAGNINSKDSYTHNNIISLLKDKSWEDLTNRGDFNSDGGLLKTMVAQFGDYDPRYKGNDKLASDWRVTWDYGNNETFDYNTNRVVLAYLPSTQMVEAAAILGIKDGAEFGTYCSYIYMTYLDFYKVQATKTLTEISYSSRFNNNIYCGDEKNGIDVQNGRSGTILITDIGKALNSYGGTFNSNVALEDEVIQLGYLALSPEAGREYRKDLVMTGMSDWIYEQYNRIVYGGSGEYAGSASKFRSGFLAIENYSDNFTTSWFLNMYVEIVIWAILIGVLLIIVVGLIKGKKISWVLVSSLMIINGLLLVPSISEIVPYFTSSITQKMFTNKMTYWSISQGVTNSSIERDLYNGANYYNSLSAEDAEAIADIVKSLSVLQTDSSLSVKQDISQKVTQKLAEGVWSDIESYQSARWILPMVMQQFTSDDMSADYIYKPLTNIWDDMSNIYWYFNPSNAEHINSQSPTLTSHQGIGVYSKELPKATKSGDRYSIYQELVKSNNTVFPDVNVNKSYAQHYGFVNSSIEYRSSAYKNDSGNLAHLVIYYLDSEAYYLVKNADNTSTKIPINVYPVIKRTDITKNGYTDLEKDDKGGTSTWQQYINNSKNILVADNWVTTNLGGFETTADSYERDDRSTITSDMPYLLCTESPIYYFYAVIKDSFNSDISLGGLIAELQGQTDKLADGTIVRENFMYATLGSPEEGSIDRTQLTPYVRDILDLEEMFYNMIPYMYQMQLLTGGFDGESGILVNDAGDPLYISDELNYYEGTLQSWMYRCNWATKIMENPNYEKACTVRDASGKKYTVENPLLWECYPEDRPMVFSEAQKQAMGLDDGDLNLVELKCIEVNEKVARQWTLLLNYAGTSGITTEVLMRQMATDATLIFCQEFSSSGLLDTTYEIYPQSLDLRYISFDSIMKMLIMNVSKDTSYIYGDTMLTVISNSDILTCILLFIAAVLGALIVPLARCILLGLIFYLGFLGVFKVILYDNKTKANIAWGQLISNGLFMLYTIVYFLIFYIMMNITSSDEVLTISNIKAEAGNPVWVLLVVILISGLYIFIMVKHIIFCWTNRADMGFTAYANIAGKVVGAVQGAADKTKEGISNLFSREENSSTNIQTNDTKSISGSGIFDFDNSSNNNSNSISSNVSNKSSESRVKQESINSMDISDDILNSSSTINDTETSSGYNIGETDEVLTNTSSEDINAEIEAGKLVDNES